MVKGRLSSAAHQMIESKDEQSKTISIIRLSRLKPFNALEKHWSFTWPDNVLVFIIRRKWRHKYKWFWKSDLKLQLTPLTGNKHIKTNSPLLTSDVNSEKVTPPKQTTAINKQKVNINKLGELIPTQPQPRGLDRGGNYRETKFKS